uniref:Uncharacterized protein n=1 Tax=Anguilla anguilla TaxID=7936 RepID=A0A0E9ST54_ANGAN
MGKLHIFTLR